MKPASPEQRELEDLAAEVCARYRDADAAQPSARIDAAILEAARHTARRPGKRNWHLPASVAAMLVIGVSLALLTSEIEDPLPPLDPGAGSGVGDAASDAGAERPVAERPGADRPGAERRAEPAAKAQPDTAEALFGREAGERLSRERSTREQAGLEYRAPQPVGPERDAGPAAPAAPTAAQAQPAIGSPPSGASALRQREAPAEIELQGRSAAGEAAKPASESAASRPDGAPADWLRRIEALLREGRKAEAEQELARFRQRHPDYPLPPGLREWHDRLTR